MAKRIARENKKLFKKAKRCLVGGVDSPVRSFGYIGTEPILVKRGSGAKIYDYDANKYIDYCLCWGAMILGHNHPEVTRSIKEGLGFGLSFGATNKPEIELAGLIRSAIPFAEKVRFVNSGTEAVMGAVRLARGYTKRDDIVKFKNAYHGGADYLLAKSGSGLATFGIPSSAGVPKDFTKHTILAPLGDLEAIERVFKKSGSKIAAVLIEPAGANYGVVPPDLRFLKKLKELTARHGSLLIFDEVVTGFRFNFGSIAEKLGVIPDLITLGKIIGGGLPIGAYGSSEKIMKHLAPCGDVYQASTFAGNTITMRAGYATLDVLKRLKTEYRKTNNLTGYLVSGLKEQALLYRIDLNVSHYGNMFSVKFKDVKIFRKFYQLMLAKGIYLAPSEFETNFLSFAHSVADIKNTINAARWALERA